MEKESTGKSRIAYIDEVRFIGILLMIMGHIGFGDMFDVWIHSFHMPLFFFISGMFYRDREIRTQIINLGKTLLIPYFVVGIFHIVIAWIVYKEIHIENIYCYVTNPATGGIQIAGALWFLPALFCTNIVYLLYRKITVNYKILTVLVATTAIIGMIWNRLLVWRMPFCLDIALVGVGFYHIGWFVNNKLKCLLKINIIWSIIILTILSFVAIRYAGYMNMRTGSYSNYFLFWINAVGIILVLMNVARVIDNICGKSLLKKYACSVGRNSIVYVCFNQLVISVATHIDRLIGISSNIQNVVILIESLVVLRIIEYAITETKLKIIFGTSRITF